MSKTDLVRVPTYPCDIRYTDNNDEDRKYIFDLRYLSIRLDTADSNVHANVELIIYNVEY